jgi:hypothetical protein
MDKGYILNWRKSMSHEDRQTFDRWLRRNVLAGAIFAAGLVTMAVLGSQQGMPPDGAVADGARPSVVAATVMPGRSLFVLATGTATAKSPARYVFGHYGSVQPVW